MKKLIKHKFFFPLVILFFLLLLRILLAFLGVPLSDVADFLFAPEEIEMWAWVAAVIKFIEWAIKIICPGAITLALVTMAIRKKYNSEGERDD